MLFDYETLKLIWWLLVGLLLIGFAIMDGHDMGVITLLPFLGKAHQIGRRLALMQQHLQFVFFGFLSL